MTNLVQDTARTVNSPFNEENLTLRSHIDPDKHWVGEALPAPSDAEVQSAGVENSAGNSPFVARADHSHDSITYFGVFNSTVMTVPPGQTFINNLLYYAGRNMLAPASQQVLQFPVPGAWETAMSLRITRDGGGLFIGEFNIVLFYNNGAYQRMIHRQSSNGLGDMSPLVDDRQWYWTVDAASNVQVALQHNDAVNWSMHVQWLEVRRLSGIVSA